MSYGTKKVVHLPDAIFLVEVTETTLTDGEVPETYTEFLGPYVKLGPARAQRTSNTYHKKFAPKKNYRTGLLGPAKERISKARIITLTGEWTEIV